MIVSDTVIIVGTKRGNEFVPSIELTQMCGRAGRKQNGETAIAHLIVEDDRIKEVQESLENGLNMDVHSKFQNMESLIFHILPEIVAKRISNIEDADKWFKRSLFYSQKGNVDFVNVFKQLEKMESIKYLDAKNIVSTKIGEIASDLYFHPGDILAWKNNFEKLFELGLENDNSAIAWALGTRPNGRSIGDVGEGHRYIIDECRNSLPLGIDMEKGMILQVVLWWCLMGGPSSGKMRNHVGFKGRYRKNNASP